MKAIVVTFPLVNLVAVPVCIAARLAIKNHATCTTGCLAAFAVYVLMTVGFLDPSTYLLSGTMELFILIALTMLADTGLQVHALDQMEMTPRKVRRHSNRFSLRDSEK